MFIQQCMNIQQKSQNGNDAKQPLLTRALLGKASTIFLATQWLAKIMHSAIVSWTSRCCTEQSTNDLVHQNNVAREIDWGREGYTHTLTHTDTHAETMNEWERKQETEKETGGRDSKTGREVQRLRERQRQQRCGRQRNKSSNIHRHRMTSWHQSP